MYFHQGSHLIDVVDFINTLIILMAFFLSTAFYKRALSFSITIAVVGVFQMFDIVFGSFVLKLGEQHLDTIVHIWYISHVILNAMVILSVYRLHLAHHIEIKAVAKMTLSVYLVLGLIHIARYVDRVVLQTELLGTFYKYGISLFSFVLSVTAFCAAIKLLWNHKLKALLNVEKPENYNELQRD